MIVSRISFDEYFLCPHNGSVWVSVCCFPVKRFLQTLPDPDFLNFSPPKGKYS